jgi:hypothetical protein
MRQKAGFGTPDIASPGALGEEGPAKADEV